MTSEKDDAVAEPLLLPRPMEAPPMPGSRRRSRPFGFAVAALLATAPIFAATFAIAIGEPPPLRTWIAAAAIAVGHQPESSRENHCLHVETPFECGYNRCLRMYILVSCRAICSLPGRIVDSVVGEYINKGPESSDPLTSVNLMNAIGGHLKPSN